MVALFKRFVCINPLTPAIWSIALFISSPSMSRAGDLETNTDAPPVDKSTDSVSPSGRPKTDVSKDAFETETDTAEPEVKASPQKERRAVPPEPESRIEFDYDSDNLLNMSLEELLDIPISTASGGISESKRITPATVTIVTKHDIRRNGWRSLAEILAYVPGLHLINDFVTPSLSVRGINGGLLAGTRIVKVMINSVPVNFKPDQTAFLGPEFIPAEAIDRVEVVKGPLSALYGANAFLATINVITKENEAGLQHEAAGRLTWQQSSSGIGYGGSAMSVYGSEFIDVAIAASGDYLDRSGLRIQRTFDAQRTDSDRFPYFSDTSRNDISRPVSGWLKLDAKLPRSAVVSAQAGLQRLDSAGEYVLNSVLSHQNRISIFNFWSNLAYTQQWTEQLSGEISIGGSHGEPTDDIRLVLPSDQRYYRVPKYQYTALNLTGSIRLDLNWLNIKVGGDFENAKERVLWYDAVPFAPNTERDPTVSPETTEYTLRESGFYAAAMGQPLHRKLPGFKLSGNIRLDHSSHDGESRPWQYSWRMSSTYQQDDWAVKIFGGRSFQEPSWVLLYAQPGIHGFGQGNSIIGQNTLVEHGMADSMLKPQIVYSVEGAGSVRLWEAVNLEASVFYQQLNDTIRFVPYAVNFMAENAGKSKFVGAEASINAFLFGRLSPSVSFDYLHPLDAEETVIPLYPKWQVMGNIGLAIPEARLFLSILGRFVTERGASDTNTVHNVSRYYTLPSYGDLDVTLSTIDLYLLGDSQETIFTASGRNLIGKTFSEPGYGGLDYPSPGRSFFFEIRQRF